MLLEYEISNFKAISGPERIPIRPITLIFGPNSSGKSSILQSLLMLKQTASLIDSPDTRLLYRGDLVDLGNYREFIYGHNVKRKFKFKVTMQMPRRLDEPAGYDPLFSDHTSDDYASLQESVLKYDKYGIAVEFCCDKESNKAFVASVELFLGDEQKPLATYEQKIETLTETSLLRRDERSPSSFLTMTRAYLMHEFLRKEGLKSVSYSADEIDQVRKDVIEKLPTEEELSEFIRLLSDRRKSALQNSKKKKKGRSKLVFIRKDVLKLCNYLPIELNGQQMHELIFGLYESYGSGNVSMITLSASHQFRKLLSRILYLGPFRSFPERQFMFSGTQTDYVGKHGQFASDILVSDKEILSKLNAQLDKFNLGYEMALQTFSGKSSDLKDLHTLRLREKSTGVSVAITDVGFGISQVLPIVLQCLSVKRRMLLIEQPELHLHPRMQAELGDLFIESALGENKNTVIVETHSEHLILRLLKRIRESSEGSQQTQIPITPDDISVIYVKPDPAGSKFFQLRVTDDGDFADRWPDGFFAERARELL